MATNPPAGAQPAAQNLPLFYKSIVPLSLEQHGNFGVDQRTKLEFTRNVHAVPVVTDEFAQVHRHYPIVFTTNEQPTPLALLGLKEGENLYLNDDGTWRENVYIPAYIRRYPFMLARPAPDADTLTLCFDETSPEIGPEGTQKFFENNDKSQVTTNVLNFCEEFEKSLQRTQFFCKELVEHGLLMDGEVSIQQTASSAPSVYRGFRMANEEKLREMRGDQARKLVQNGALPLIYAHLFSVSIIREVFARANPLPQAATQSPVVPEVPGNA